jgi:2-C-methyl-D-erythritol 4-phosphate cytidylyltransferase / 2-C-methyl-D-erythritol 2,4-cyclodiphosphate synthase
VNETTPVALVLAAGQGRRVGGDVPKQLLMLGGRPVIMHAIEQHLRLGHRVVTVVAPTTRAEIDDLLTRRLGDHRVTVVAGGATRRESVLAGVRAIPPDTGADTAVVLRNAASPNTPDPVVIACVDGVAETDGMQAFRPSDTTTILRRGERLEQMLARSTTGFTCDPTVYRRRLLDAIGEAMEAGDPGDTTLDIARRLGAEIGLVESPASNIKITTADDLDRLAVLMGDD